MGWKNTKYFLAWQARRSQRVADRGRQFEQKELPGLLEQMQAEGHIESFKISEPFSARDHRGIDCTVGKRVNGEILVRGFGVTISPRRFARSKYLHPDVPQFCFPIGTKPETIRRRVLGLFPRAEARLAGTEEAVA